MQESLFSALMPLVWLLVGFFTAQIAQRIAVPILVSCLGEQRFASPSAFDGCTLGIAGVFVSLAFLPLSVKTGLNPIWAFHIVFLGITLYGLIWLWGLGLSARKREWRFEGDKILGNENQVLAPTFIHERSDWTQTDAYNSYSQYFLDLHDDEKKLATNAYNSEREKDQDIAKLDERAKARRLDLRIVWRAEERKWAVFYFRDRWTLLLCGPLTRLTKERREWWRQWLRPNLQSETEIHPADWQEQLRVLSAAYPEFWRATNKVDYIHVEESEVLNQPPGSQTWEYHIVDLQWILENATSEVLAMPRATFEQSAQDAVGGYVMLEYGTEKAPFVVLSPMYGEPKKKKEKQ